MKRKLNWLWIVLLLALLAITLFGCVAAHYAKNQPNKWDTYPDTCCMFTGLHDKNGVALYEGDIVKDDIGQGVIVYYRPTHDFAIFFDKEVLMEIDGRRITKTGSIYIK